MSAAAVSGGVGRGRSSTSEFHAPHSAQRPATSATARRIPGRRRHRSSCACSFQLPVPFSSRRNGRNCDGITTAIAVSDLATGTGNCTELTHTPAGSSRPLGTAARRESCRSRRRFRARRCDSSPCCADDDDLVARCNVDAGHVDHGHVHADRADDRRAAAADQHVPRPGEPQIEAVRVAGRHDGDRRATVADECSAVAGAFAGRMPFTCTIRLCSDRQVAAASVAASGGGTMP